MSDKVVVRFLKAWRGYSADELAGFEEEVVEGLKSKGFAEIYEGAGESASKSKSSKNASKPAGQKGAGKVAPGLAPESQTTTRSVDGEGSDGGDNGESGGDGGDGAGDNDAKP